MPIHNFGEWYYLIYLVPGGAAMVVLLLSAFGGRHHAGGHGHGAGHQAPQIAASHHGTPGLTHAATGQMTSHAGAAHGGHQAAAHGHPPHVSGHKGGGVGAFFGVGRLPVTMVWGGLMLGWGLFGTYGTEFWEMALKSPLLFVPLGAATGALGSVGVGRILAIVGSRMLPDTESFAVSSVELFGCRGSVVYPVDKERGRVHVYDAYGTLHDKEARIAHSHDAAGSTSGSERAIQKGKTVLVLDVDYDTDRLIVEEAAE